MEASSTQPLYLLFNYVNMYRRHVFADKIIPYPFCPMSITYSIPHTNVVIYKSAHAYISSGEINKGMHYAETRFNVGGEWETYLQQIVAYSVVTLT